MGLENVHSPVFGAGVLIEGAVEGFGIAGELRGGHQAESVHLGLDGLFQRSRTRFTGRFRCVGS